jgi:hypothetical protein
VTNTPAYFGTELIAVVKSFVTALFSDIQKWPFSFDCEPPTSLVLIKAEVETR